MQGVSLSTAAALPIEIDEKFPFRIELELYEDDGTTPRTADGQWRMGIAVSPESEPFTILENGDGIELDTNKVIIARDIESIDEGLQVPGKYFYDLRNDLSASEGEPVLKSTFTVKQFITPPAS